MNLQLILTQCSIMSNSAKLLQKQTVHPFLQRNLSLFVKEIRLLLSLCTTQYQWLICMHTHTAQNESELKAVSLNGNTQTCSTRIKASETSVQSSCYQVVSNPLRKTPLNSMQLQSSHTHALPKKARMITVCFQEHSHPAFPNRFSFKPWPG